MGINVGDIIRDGRDIYGDGVNVAGRLERVRCRLSAGGKEIRTLGPPVEDGAWTASAELREVPAGQLRFAPDSPLEGDGFELPVPREKYLRSEAEGRLARQPKSPIAATAFR
jgi:class 3 adenylate cyclase